MHYSILLTLLPHLAAVASAMNTNVPLTLSEIVCNDPHDDKFDWHDDVHPTHQREQADKFCGQYEGDVMDAASEALSERAMVSDVKYE